MTTSFTPCQTSTDKGPLHTNGFSLIEVLVSIIVIAVGLLGLAKMQTLSIANTQVSGGRSLIALQAASFAANMHSDKGYWQVTSTVATPVSPPCLTACTFSGSSTITDANSVLTSPPSAACTAAATCTPGKIAALDVKTWMANIYQQVPTYAASVNCTNSTTTPTNCTIKITWVEKSIGANNTTASLMAAQNTQTQSYYLYVQP